MASLVNKVAKNGDSGRRKTDTLLYKLIYIGYFMLGGGATSGAIQYLSPTNAALEVKLVEEQARIDRVSQRVENYIASHKREEELSDKNIANILNDIKEDVGDIKDDIKDIKNGRH